MVNLPLSQYVNTLLVNASHNILCHCSATVLQHLISSETSSSVCAL